MDKADGAGEQLTQTIEEKRSRAETKPVCRDKFGRVHDAEDPRGADDLAIPDYVMWDFEINGGGSGKELEETVSQNHTKQSAEGAPLRRPPAPAYWLIARNPNGRIEVLTLNCKETLPIFSHEEEAQMFLRLSRDAEDEGWRVTESRAGELVSMLYWLCAEVKEVALDPLPEMVAERIVELVSLDRRCFIERMMTRRRALRHDWEEGEWSSGRRG